MCHLILGGKGVSSDCSVTVDASAGLFFLRIMLKASKTEQPGKNLKQRLFACTV